MLDYIRGEIAEITPTYAVIDCSGVGYMINISLIDFTALQAEKSTKLYVHEAIREDAHLLYGFRTQRARELFRLLIGVSGVGPNTARLIMSSLTVEQIESAISSGQDAPLKAVKGIGGRIAQRIIVDLKDKIKGDASTLITSSVQNESYDDAVAALVMLGFTAQQSQKVLKKIFAAKPDTTTEQAIKQALSMM